MRDERGQWTCSNTHQRKDSKQKGDRKIDKRPRRRYRSAHFVEDIRQMSKKRHELLGVDVAQLGCSPRGSGNSLQGFKCWLSRGRLYRCRGLRLCMRLCLRLRISRDRGRHIIDMPPGGAVGAIRQGLDSRVPAGLLQCALLSKKQSIQSLSLSTMSASSSLMSGEAARKRD